MGFLCHKCGEYHDELPFAYGASAPRDWWSLGVEEDENCSLTDDVCIINASSYYIRGSIEIPVHECNTPFSWDVWILIKKEDMILQFHHWDLEGREEILEPMLGELSTELPIYPSTYGLKVVVHTRKCGRCPYIELEIVDHPLVVEQRNGISIDRVKEIAALIHHGRLDNEKDI